MNASLPLTSPHMQMHVGAPSSPAEAGEDIVASSPAQRERKGPIAQQWGGEGKSEGNRP